MKRLYKTLIIMTTMFAMTVAILGFNATKVSAQTKPIDEQEYAEIACTHADTGYYRDVVSTKIDSYHNSGAIAHVDLYEDKVYEGTVCAACGQKLTRTLTSTSRRQVLTAMHRYGIEYPDSWCEYCSILLTYKQECVCSICGYDTEFTFKTNNIHHEICPYFRK